MHLIRKLTLSFSLFVFILVPTSAYAYSVFNPSISLQAQSVSATQIKLSWAVTNPGALSTLRIYRAPGNTPLDFSLLTTISSTVTTYTDNGLLPNTTYAYQLKASQRGSIILSAPSNTITAT